MTNADKPLIQQIIEATGIAVIGMAIMAAIVLVAAGLLCLATTHAHAQTTYQTYGNTTYGSDGSIAQTYGDTTYINPPPNFTAPPQPTTICQTYGNLTYCN